MNLILLAATILLPGALCIQAGDLGTVPDALKQDLSKAGQTISGQKPADMQDFHLPFNRSVPEEMRRQMIEDMVFISGIRGQGRASVMHRYDFGLMAGDFYIDFFRQHVRHIAFKANKKNNGQIASLYRIGGWSEMRLTAYFTTHDVPQIGRMETLMHEAWHADDRCQDHVPCPSPFPFQGEEGVDTTKLAGERACDGSINGAYGATAIMLQNIVRFCANCSEKVLADAKRYGYYDGYIRLVNQRDRELLDADIKNEN